MTCFKWVGVYSYVFRAIAGCRERKHCACYSKLESKEGVVSCAKHRSSYTTCLPPVCISPGVGWQRPRNTVKFHGEALTSTAFCSSLWLALVAWLWKEREAVIAAAQCRDERWLHSQTTSCLGKVMAKRDVLENRRGIGRPAAPWDGGLAQELGNDQTDSSVLCVFTLAKAIPEAGAN